MIIRLLTRLSFLPLAVNAAAQTPSNLAPAKPCEALKTATIPDVHITDATPVAATNSGVAHCKVAGVIGPEIQFMALLPTAWNGRFVMGGGGGFVGRVESQAAAEVNNGYVVGGTDTGHQGSGIEAGWALGRDDRQANYGHVAVHRTTETIKALIQTYYGRPAERSYFFGCSNGGRQALMEAQRYPEDFDGIVSGAPSFNFTDIAISFLRNQRALFPNPSQLTNPVLPPALLRMVEAKILAACDKTDGIQDSVLADPRACRFNVASIASCPNDEPGPECLTKAQLAALETIYRPVADDKGEIYPGQPFGGEGQQGAWHVWITGDPQAMRQLGDTKVPSAQWAFGTEFFKYLVFGDSGWSYASYDMSRARTDVAAASKVLNADSPDLDRFIGRGGKLILWHGWSDPALNALATIRYHRDVLARRSSAEKAVRLFLMPGVLHCFGGSGPDRVDWVKAVADWVERDRAPERVVAAKLSSNGTPRRTRPLCAYPAAAVWSGKGSSDDEAEFRCARR